jgi:hypothetical protein
MSDSSRSSLTCAPHTGTPQRFEDFLEQVRARHEAGRAEYGDRSYALQPAQLAEEIQEELADVCGWSAVLWARLEAAKEAAARFKGRREPMAYHGAKNGLVVIQDSREKYTPRFPEGIEVQRAKLDFADYSAAGLTDSVALELKWSLDDLSACVTGERERFETMLAGLAKYPVRALIVAASEADVWARRYHSRLEPKALIASTWAWAQQYGVPVVWAWDAACATEAIVWWLQRAAAKQKGPAA